MPLKKMNRPGVLSRPIRRGASDQAIKARLSRIKANKFFIESCELKEYLNPMSEIVPSSPALRLHTLDRVNSY
jgi:hypothetical protein